MISPVEQAVGHAAYFRLQLAGYFIFAAAWGFIAAAVMQFLLDVLDTDKSDEPGRAPSPVPARGSRVDRLSPVSAIPPVVSPAPAMSARVIAFAPRRTRNRVVVR